MHIMNGHAKGMGGGNSECDEQPSKAQPIWQQKTTSKGHRIPDASDAAAARI